MKLLINEYHLTFSNINLLPVEEEECSSSEESKVASSEEALYKDYEIMMEESQPSLDLSVIEEKDKTLSKEELYAGSLNTKEDDCAPVNSFDVEKNYAVNSSLELSFRVEKSDSGSITLSKEELHTGSLNSKEDDCAPVISSAVEENDRMDSVLEPSLREEKSDSGSRSSIKETDTKMSSQDRVEERLNFDPDIVAPAASEVVSDFFSLLSVDLMQLEKIIRY